MLGHRQLKATDYLNILKRHWLLIAIPAVLFPVIGVAATYFIAPRYLSQTLVLIEQQKVPDDYVKPVVSSDLDDRLASMQQQILSRSRLQPIVERMNLYPTLSMADRVETAQKNILITPIHSEIAHSGGLPGFFISFQASDPRTAQAVCGEIESLFVNENIHDRTQSAEGTTDFLKGQLDDAKHSLDEQDARLADFQRKYNGKLPDEESPNLNMLTSLNTQLEAATQQLARMEQDKTYEDSMLAQQTREVASDPVLQPVQAVQKAELDQLVAQEADMAAQYTSDYPDLIAIRRKISALRAKNAQQAATKTTVAVQHVEPVNVQQLRATIRAQEQGITEKRQEQANLQHSISIYQSRIESSPLVEEQYKEITRDDPPAQNFYDDLLAKMNQSKMATDLELRQQGQRFRVMDAPNLPDTPSFPKRPYFAGSGLLLGLTFGLGMTALLEYRDKSIRTEEDIRELLQMPTLAIISLTKADSPNESKEKPPIPSAPRPPLSIAPERHV